VVDRIHLADLVGIDSDDAELGKSLRRQLRVVANEVNALPRSASGGKFRFSEQLYGKRPGVRIAARRATTDGC
jgi:hypothetical protein